MIESDREPSERMKKSALRMRLIDLFERTKNLRVLDWCGAIGPASSELHVLRGLDRLRTFRVDCGFYTGFTSNFETEGVWEIDDFVSTVGPNLTSLDFRKVNMKTYISLVANASRFAAYHALKRLYLDLTEGVWDWDGAGSPQSGASNEFSFSNLGFPAVEEVGMRVGDLTIASERAGPMDIIDWEPLKSLSLFVDPCVYWCSIRSLCIFMALPPEKFASLVQLEIQDTTRNDSPWKWPDEPRGHNEWAESGRCYWGLVPQFLASVRSESLSNLVHLWVNQRVLCMPKGTPADYALFGGDVGFYDVGELWVAGADEEENARKAEWIAILRAVLGRLESLRVGFGPMSAEEVGLVLECCSRDRLAQFGFQYKWRVCERKSTISSALLDHLAQSPALVDLHLLQPRPGTHAAYRSSVHAENGRTLDDISAIFKCNPNLCRVGIGQNTVWERWSFPLDPDYAATDVILAQDGYCDPRLLVEGAVPRFFDIGVLETYPDDGHSMRPEPTSDIKELRNLLERILPSPEDST
ncbi:hypothetical protein LshimejAT787_0600430 [Lyophyllum shimeji]|uniref:Uncharacterized protein n=1 Tax=Lyophyllum shimeji TaxID=47721 RepID=A0A9P3PP72_LYOSH|nr:hypothetical protein LshimejAT787_0600430 [Lyophyllum shimeji]